MSQKSNKGDKYFKTVLLGADISVLLGKCKNQKPKRKDKKRKENPEGITISFNCLLDSAEPSRETLVKTLPLKKNNNNNTLVVQHQHINSLCEVCMFSLCLC